MLPRLPSPAAPQHWQNLGVEEIELPRVVTELREHDPIRRVDVRAQVPDLRDDLLRRPDQVSLASLLEGTWEERGEVVARFRLVLVVLEYVIPVGEGK